MPRPSSFTMIVEMASSPPNVSISNDISMFFASASQEFQISSFIASLGDALILRSKSSGVIFTGKE